MRIAKSLKYGKELSNIIPSGYTVIWDADKCDTCGTCTKVCMFGAIKQDDAGNPIYDKDACMGCGICVEKCKGAARSLSADFTKEYPLDIDLAKEKGLLTDDYWLSDRMAPLYTAEHSKARLLWWAYKIAIITHWHAGTLNKFISRKLRLNRIGTLVNKFLGTKSR